MIRPIVLSMVPGLFLLACLGCGSHSAAPGREAAAPRPESELRFEVLYKQNCAGCHGADGKNGAAMDLANPEYQSLVDDSSLTRWISNGMPQTQMPAFAMSAGGFLTDKQIGVLVSGMRRRWAQPVAPAQLERPSYTEPGTGDATRGRVLFQTSCISCHKASKQEITSPDYLALVNDQALRSIIVAGRPDIGQPDWRNDKPGTPLSEQNVSDIVHYLASLRTATPGQPYPEHREGAK
jgi:cytochrome c oxidase cbb3-type subunit III